MSWYPEYVPVAMRIANAERKMKQFLKKRPGVQPVIIEGRLLAKTWWGKSWNKNLERYADYANRIERGRNYVRYRSVLDLQLQSGRVSALVLGSRATPYTVTIRIEPLSSDQWSAIRQACSGRFDSLSGLLAGTFPKALKDLFFDAKGGLFPTPDDIAFDCSCPDWASMCKHVAATLYGIGHRLDGDAGLFFTLRGITVDEIISQTVAETTQALLNKSQARGKSQSQGHGHGKGKRKSGVILRDVDLGAVFGIELTTATLPPAPPLPRTSKKPSPSQAAQPTPVPKRTLGDNPKRHPVQVKLQVKPEVKPQAKLQVKPQAKLQVKLQVKPEVKPQVKPKGRPRLLPPPPTIAANPKRAPRQPSATPARPEVPHETMLDTLVKAVGKTRSGESIAQIEQRLVGWSTLQIRNTLQRASTRGLIKIVQRGRYRRLV